MNVSSLLGPHGWLHVIMFAVIAVLIKRCTEMQNLPTNDNLNERLFISSKGAKHDTEQETKSDIENYHDNHKNLIDYISWITLYLKFLIENKSSLLTSHTTMTSKRALKSNHNTPIIKYMLDSLNMENLTISNSHKEGQKQNNLNESGETMNNRFVSAIRLGDLMHDADNSKDVLQGIGSLQDHNENPAAYCSTAIHGNLGTDLESPSLDKYSETDFDIKDDITEESDTYDLFTKASTFVIDSTVGTFMQMTQAYMQDDYISSHQVEQNYSHVIEKEGSSVWCWGSDHTHRICRFHNLCYLPDQDDFVFFHSPNTIIHGVPSDRFSPTLLDISSVHDHNGQYFNYVDLPSSQASGLEVELIETTSLIYRRFNPDNLMHVIHDDLLPMFYTLHMISENNTTGESLPFDIQLVFIEDWNPGDYFNLYQLFSSFKPMLKTELQANSKLTCFSDVYVGLTKDTTWYQYGFREPQGPVPGHTVTAHEIRMFTSYLKNSLNIHSVNVPNGQDYIVLLTRKHNRLILNDIELTMALVLHLQVKVITVGIETHTVAEIAAILSKAAVLIGMHGSLLSMAMFLHPGSILVELFPYAVNPEHYTPYKTLTSLPGMNILYKSWRNIDPTKSVGHPNRVWDTGGISHLPKCEQERILRSTEVPRHLCCRDPEWLYRIYQDTIVDTDAVVSLVNTALDERAQMLKSSLLKNSQQTYRLNPGQVLQINCVKSEYLYPASIHSLTPPSIALSWQPPWNVQYLNPRSVKYEVWIQEQGHKHYTAWILSRTSYRFSTGLKPQTNYSIWVRCILNDLIHGPFNKDGITCVT